MFDDQAVRHANGWFRHSAVHAFHRSDRLLVWSVCRHYDRSGLRQVQFVLEPIFYTIPQMLLDYPLAFGALGLAGFFNKKKWGLQIGYIVGVIGRFVFATISGVVFFAAYAPEGMSPLAYSAGYQASYLVPEAIITLIIICIPPVSHALAEVRKRAVEA